MAYKFYVKNAMKNNIVIMNSETFKLYYKEVGKIDYKTLTPQEEQILFAQIKLNDLKSKNFMVENNLRYVVKCVIKAYKPIDDIMEMISYGNDGLYAAIDSFDPSKGNRFSTHLHWKVKDFLSRYRDKTFGRNGEKINIPLDENIDCAYDPTYNFDTEDNKIMLEDFLVKNLSFKEKKVVDLYYIDGYTIKEIMQITNFSRNKVITLKKSFDEKYLKNKI